MSQVTVSQHFLRRRARARAESLNDLRTLDRHVAYRVVRARRGPFRWRVVKITVRV